jgi:hypothetical protein
MYGRIYTFYSPKYILLCAIGIFEVGVSWISNDRSTSRADTLRSPPFAVRHLIRRHL